MAWVCCGSTCFAQNSNTGRPISELFTFVCSSLDLVYMYVSVLLRNYAQTPQPKVSKPKGRMNTWVGCGPTAALKKRTHAGTTVYSSVTLETIQYPGTGEYMQ